MKNVVVLLAGSICLMSTGCNRTGDQVSAPWPTPVVIQVVDPQGRPVTNAIVLPSRPDGSISLIGVPGANQITDKEGIVRGEEYRFCPIIGIARIARGYQYKTVTHAQINPTVTNIIILTPEKEQAKQAHSE